MLDRKQSLSLLIEALDAMPVKELIRYHLIRSDRGCCAMGALGQYLLGHYPRPAPLDDGESNQLRFAINRVIDAKGFDPLTWRDVTTTNDDDATEQWPSERWQRMRSWAAEQLEACDA